MTDRLLVRRARSVLSDEHAAVLELNAQLQADNASVVVFYCSEAYDLPRLGRALAETFPGPVMGCTSAGQIADTGYVDGGITAVSLTSSQLRASPHLISPLSDSNAAAEVGYHVVAELVRSSSRKGFGVLLIDGHSGAEERTISALFEVLGDVPLVGGSAADEHTNAGTFVYHAGAFHQNAAVFTLFETTLPFSTFKVQHVVPGRTKVVITEADAGRRLVYEINGKPAAAEYARLIGIHPVELTPVVSAEHPLIWSVGGEHFVRGIRAVNADGSLSFYCAIETGLVLSIGEPTSALAALDEGFARATERVVSPAVVLGFDCVSRRREFERRGEADTVGHYLASQTVVGFCTYGEQFGSLHVNQTFTAVVIGGGD
ncbi:MAG: hypothetical protein K0R38_6830 [Polyangiaceae bacterium]|jgi:hypothetical protein|nr:hypothetical protein [Polyangiaceae bacterium]